MSSLQYINGDITTHDIDNAVIPHICNDMGMWGAGFTRALSNKWYRSELAYRNWATTQNKFELGGCQFVKVDDTIVVANMIAQHKIYKSGNRPPIRYGALATAMGKVLDYAGKHNLDVHCPKFGAGLAGGAWKAIEQLILEIWVDNGLSVTVYEL